VSTLTLPRSRRRGDERLLRAIRALDRICAEPSGRRRLEAEVGPVLAHWLLADMRRGTPRAPGC